MSSRAFVVLCFCLCGAFWLDCGPGVSQEKPGAPEVHSEGVQKPEPASKEPSQDASDPPEPTTRPEAGEKPEPAPEPAPEPGPPEPRPPEALQEPTPEKKPAPVLLQPKHLVYQGAFRVPSDDNGSPKWSGLNYGGTALAFDPSTKSLFLVGHDHHQLAAEISVPALVKASDIQQLKRAKFLQAFADPAEGNLGKVDQGNVKIGDLLVLGSLLFGTAYSYYDADANQKLSSFVRDRDLSKKSFRGFYQVGTVGAGFVSGYMEHIPSEWQAQLGGPALIGQCCLAIVGRTSYGPAVSAFSPATLGKTKPTPATPLVYYDSKHPLGEWGKTGTLFNGSTAMAGVVLPKGSRSVLFFGRQGTGPFCYGTGQECKDPTDSSKGNHAYPYINQIWAYDVEMLRQVKQGFFKPWEARPYKTWEIKLPFSNGSRILNGTAYDPITQRIYISQRNTDKSLPLIHVLKVELNP